MKQFIQHHFNRSMLKAAVGFLLLIAGLQPGYGQCVQCDSTTTTGWSSSAIGRYTQATGNYSFAGGDESTASGTNAFAFGNESKALNTGAFASGLRAEASGRHSTAFGRASKASDENAIALGYVSEALAPNAIVIGKHARVSAGNSYLIGSGTGLGTGMIINDVGYSFMIGMKSNLPTFFVSSSTGVGTTGRIGMGNMTDPQAKLHIYSDVDEAASLKLEHRTTGTNRYAEISLGTHSIRAANTENMVFSTPAGNRHFVFETGNIGIGSEDPKAKLQVKDGDIFIEDINRGIIMKSPDGRCWRGVLNNSGQLEFTEIQDCIISSTNTQTLQPDLGVTISPNPVSDRLEVECRLIGAEARLMNLSGIEIFSHPLQQGASFIPVHDLKPGMYLLNIVMQGKGVVETHKFVKQ